MEPEFKIDPPTHADAVERGFKGAEPEVTDEVDVIGDFKSKLAAAMKREFPFMQADDAAWEQAAGGILGKLGAEVTSGEGGVVIVTIP